MYSIFREKDTEIVTNRQTVKVKEYILDERRALLEETISKTYKISNEIDKQTGESIRTVSINLVGEKKENTKKYPLKEITLEELAEIRESKTPSFLIKDFGKYYWAKIPAKMCLLKTNIMGEHKCANSTHDCAHISAASDEEGGCARVRAKYPKIEDFDFIKVGYQKFNTPHDEMNVIICMNHEVCPSRK